MLGGSHICHSVHAEARGRPAGFSCLLIPLWDLGDLYLLSCPDSQGFLTLKP